MHLLKTLRTVGMRFSDWKAFLADLTLGQRIVFLACMVLDISILITGVTALNFLPLAMGIVIFVGAGVVSFVLEYLVWSYIGNSALPGHMERQ